MGEDVDVKQCCVGWLRMSMLGWVFGKGEDFEAG
jgi:hypothetical protein